MVFPQLCAEIPLPRPSRRTIALCYAILVQAVPELPHEGGRRRCGSSILFGTRCIVGCRGVLLSPSSLRFCNRLLQFWRHAVAKFSRSLCEKSLQVEVMDPNLRRHQLVQQSAEE